MDAYRNLTYKNIMGKTWVVTFCSQVKEQEQEQELVQEQDKEHEQEQGKGKEKNNFRQMLW